MTIFLRGVSPQGQTNNLVNSFLGCMCWRCSGDAAEVMCGCCTEILLGTLSLAEGRGNYSRWLVRWSRNWTLLPISTCTFSLHIWFLYFCMFEIFGSPPAPRHFMVGFFAMIILGSVSGLIVCGDSLPSFTTPFIKRDEQANASWFPKWPEAW